MSTDTAGALIGFIGQGFIGKNYADNFESRGFTVIRYALEEPYAANKDKIADCDIVFIAVPTPTKQSGFDDTIVRAAIGLVGTGKTVVIKSTILPGLTRKLQESYPDRTVLYSPEFLSEATAAHDAAHPFSNIVGMSVDDAIHLTAAEAVLAVLPEAPFSKIMTSTEAEIIKYTHNASGYVQVVLFNMMYDLAAELGVSWEDIGAALKADPYISNRYANPVHKSGRGAGGHCFIKDFAALRELYAELLPNDARGKEAFASIEEKNVELLRGSGKDLDLIDGVYGKGV
jgi:UDPglucose 6-dehydrogenase